MEKEVYYPYLIIGGGAAASACVEGIRALDCTNKIAIICEESFPPYRRPPLTKGLWMGEPLDSIWAHFEGENVSLFLNTKVVSIDPDQKIVQDEKGDLYRYDKLLIATGGIPRPLECPDPGVIYYRNLSHYYHLRTLYETGSDFVVVGGGFIGTEISASLASNGKKVTFIFLDSLLGEKKYPEPFCQFVSELFLEQGVRLVPEDTVVSVRQEEKKYKVKTRGGKEFLVDGVIAGIGITPNVELARKIGLKVDNGIVVDDFLQTSRADIFAAGDVANFYYPAFGKRLRIEHEDAAITMGKVAGENMVGKKTAYKILPFHYSEIFDLCFEGVGQIDSSLEMIEEWDEPYRRGIVYYLNEGCVVGALLVGVWEKVEMIREMINSKQIRSLV